MDGLPVRGTILAKASIATLKERNVSYGDCYTDMSCAAELEAIYTRHAGKKYDPAHDEAMRRVFCKIARIACGAVGHEDNYVDGSAYFAIAAECQAVATKPYVAPAALSGSLKDFIPELRKTNRLDGIKPVMKARSSLRCVHCPDKDAIVGRDICLDCNDAYEAAKGHVQHYEYKGQP